jgi:hypothetical protein
MMTRWGLLDEQIRKPTRYIRQHKAMKANIGQETRAEIARVRGTAQTGNVGATRLGKRCDDMQNGTSSQ